MRGKVRYGGVKLLVVYLFWCWVSLWLSSKLSSSDSSNTGQEGRCGCMYYLRMRLWGKQYKNACLPDAIFSHIRFSLLSSSSCIACTLLSLLLNCSWRQLWRFVYKSHRESSLNLDSPLWLCINSVIRIFKKSALVILFHSYPFFIFPV